MNMYNVKMDLEFRIHKHWTNAYQVSTLSGRLRQQFKIVHATRLMRKWLISFHNTLTPSNFRNKQFERTCMDCMG